MSRSSSLARLQKALALAMAGLLLLLTVEVGFRVAISVSGDSDSDGPSQVEDPRVKSAPYQGASFDVDAFFAELRAAGKETYRPYVVWRSRPFDGEFIDIDEEGNRGTHGNFESSDPENAQGDDVLQIWLLGGSVIWGLGAPDPETVSSLLARELGEQMHVRALVRNLGEIGFVNTQEIVLLMRELQLGRRPDIVVFLDGVNDARAAVLWPEVDGNHVNFTSVRDRFEDRESEELSPFWRLLRGSGTWRMADALRRKLGIQPARQAAPPYTIPSDPAEARRRGERAAEIWLANRRFVDALGDHYGFTPFYLLQPSLQVGDKLRDPSELALLESELENDAKRVGMEGFAAMRAEVRRQLQPADAGELRTVDLTDLFSDVPTPLYFDYVHVGPAGNELIASGIADALFSYACAGSEKTFSTPIPAGLMRSCEYHARRIFEKEHPQTIGRDHRGPSGHSR